MKIKKHQVLVFVLFNTFIIMVGAYVVFGDSSELKDIENTFFGHDETPIVEICDFQIRDLDYFESEFRARKQVKKLAGSRPIKFYVVKLSNSRAQEQLYLGQDSRNPSLFWIYPSIEPSLISQLGFMNLNYDFSSIRCNFIKQSWVEKAFVW